MNLAALSTAISARIADDTGAGGLAHATSPIINGYWLDLAPETAKTPYVVWTIAVPRGNDTFPNDGGDVLVEFYVYTDRRDGFAGASAIIDRIFGDAMAHDPPVPTYGFQRHVLSISGYEATACQFENADSASDESKRIWRVAFTLSMWKSSTA